MDASRARSMPRDEVEILIREHMYELGVLFEVCDVGTDGNRQRDRIAHELPDGWRDGFKAWWDKMDEYYKEIGEQG